MYIRALKNLRNKDYISNLLLYIEGPAKKPAIYAMRALQTMPSHFITDQVL